MNDPDLQLASIAVATQRERQMQLLRDMLRAVVGSPDAAPARPESEARRSSTLRSAALLRRASAARARVVVAPTGIAD